PQPLLAVPAFVLVDVFEPILPAGLGFAAGAMLWMSFAELAPEARRRLSLARVVALGLAACAAMVLLQTFVFGL
ncbi:MAG: ZIP family metal transporter, partial [Miltoncostaeaceae bacterium]